MTTTSAEPHDRLLMDEMFSVALAHQLVQLGVDCRSVAADPDLSPLGDESIAEAALEEDRVLVTDNAVDFEILRRRREAEGRTMPKLIYTCDDRFPRNRSFARALAEALVAAATEQRATREGGVCWLSPPPSHLDHLGAAPEGVPEPTY
jgi:predicted nuclease of predicted toxin-antitoxin system